jgi:predicted transcriptional regulator
MGKRRSYSISSVGEAIAPYGREASGGPHTKLSISLPSELVELVRGVARARGLSVSAVIGGALRRTLEEADQARLDAAIDAQNEENLEWSKAYLPMAAKLWSELEW